MCLTSSQVDKECGFSRSGHLSARHFHLVQCRHMKIVTLLLVIVYLPAYLYVWLKRYVSGWGPGGHFHSQTPYGPQVPRLIKEVRVYYKTSKNANKSRSLLCFIYVVSLQYSCSQILLILYILASMDIETSNTQSSIQSCSVFVQQYIQHLLQMRKCQSVIIFV